MIHWEPRRQASSGIGHLTQIQPWQALYTVPVAHISVRACRETEQKSAAFGGICLFARVPPVPPVLLEDITEQRERSGNIAEFRSSLIDSRQGTRRFIVSKTDS